MTKRSYRWLLVVLAVIGLTADQLTKYNVFRWLYHQGPEQPTDNKEAAFVAWNRSAPAWVPGSAPGVQGGRYDVIPGWFGFIAQYNPPLRTDSDKDWREGLQTASAPKMPHVNRGALFGMGANQGGANDPNLTPDQRLAELRNAEQQAETANTLFAVISLIAAGGICVWTVLRGKRADAWICAALGLILGGTVGNLYDRVVFYGVRDFLFFYKIDWPVFNVADCCLVCGAAMLVLHAVFVKPAKSDVAGSTTAAATTPLPAPTTAG